MVEEGRAAFVRPRPRGSDAVLQWLTPAERRGATVVALILLIGAGHDAWKARRMSQELRRAEAEPAVAAAPPPTLDPRATAAGPESSIPPAAGTLDLNRASARDLDALPGIGPVLAERILAYRRERGGFARVEDLLAVRGIGPRLFARLRSRLSVGRITPAAADARGPDMHSAPSARDGRADSASDHPTTSR